MSSQVVQEGSVGDAGGAMRVKRLCLPNGDDYSGKTAEIHDCRSKAQIKFSPSYCCYSSFQMLNLLL